MGSDCSHEKRQTQQISVRLESCTGQKDAIIKENENQKVTIVNLLSILEQMKEKNESLESMLMQTSTSTSPCQGANTEIAKLNQLISTLSMEKQRVEFKYLALLTNNTINKIEELNEFGIKYGVFDFFLDKKNYHGQIASRDFRVKFIQAFNKLVVVVITGDFRVGEYKEDSQALLINVDVVTEDFVNFFINNIFLSKEFFERVSHTSECSFLYHFKKS
jgi:hypothetical protein